MIYDVLNNSNYDKFITDKFKYNSDISPSNQQESLIKKELYSKLNNYNFTTKKQTFFHKLPKFFIVRFTTAISENRDTINKKYDLDKFKENFETVTLPTLDLESTYNSLDPNSDLNNQYIDIKSSYQINKSIQIKYKLHSVILKSTNHWTYLKNNNNNTWTLFDDDNVSILTESEAINKYLI